MDAALGFIAFGIFIDGCAWSFRCAASFDLVPKESNRDRSWDGSILRRQAAQELPFLMGGAQWPKNRRPHFASKGRAVLVVPTPRAPTMACHSRWEPLCNVEPKGRPNP